MPKLLDMAYFSPEGIEVDLEQRVISGGTALNGEEDVVATDGGGRWFSQITDPYLDDVPVAKAWRALSGYLDGGANPIRLRICDCRHQPGSEITTVPHSDGTPFSDDTEYAQDGAVATVTANAALRATTLAIDTSLLPEDLGGGERFTVIHTTYLDRLYEVIEVDEDAGTITFRPPLREAVAAGASLNFGALTCMMRLDGEMRSPTSFGFAESPGARFIEHFPGPGGYA
jgi:hypothetical protein